MNDIYPVSSAQLSPGSKFTTTVGLNLNSATITSATFFNAGTKVSFNERVGVANLSPVSINVNQEKSVLERTTDAIGPDVSVISVDGRPHAVFEAFVSYLGSGYHHKLMAYPFSTDYCLSAEFNELIPALSAV